MPRGPPRDAHDFWDTTPGPRDRAPRLGGGELWGLAGDGFLPAGGIEGAYLSGLALAERFTESLTTSS